MKNRFFGIVFAIAALPMFANEATDNAKLLAHLKNVKSEIALCIEEHDCELKKAGFQGVVADHVKEVASEFYNKAELFQKICAHEIFIPLFDFICKNQGLSFKEIYREFEHTVGYQSWNSIWMNNQIMEELFELYVPVLKKLNETHPVAHELTDDVARYCFNGVVHSVCLLRVSVYAGHIFKLIDEKIAELEE